jgi:ribosomal protein S18 acetylase RimI-like enzyme
MNIAIRPYTNADFDVIASIWFDSWNSTGVVTQPVTLASLRKRLPQEITRGWVIHLATIGSDVVGFLAVYENKLEQLFIVPGLQGNGLGKRLLDFAKAQNPQGFWLTTAADNDRAIRFYEREGLKRGEMARHLKLKHPIVRYDWLP